MQENLHPIHWLPFIWILLQAYLFFSITLFFLRRTKLLVSPVAGMEYGHVVVAGSIILGSLFVPTAEIDSVFQAVKTFQYSGEQVMQKTLMYFARYFVIGVFSIGLYLVATLCNQRFVFKSSGDGNIAWGVLTACVNIGFAIVLWFWLKELAGRITPEFVNFR